VWEENWQTVAMFLRMGTQWNASFGGLTGLNYPSLQWLLTMYPADDPVMLFEGIQMMESEALSILNSKKG
jgi:hypothetical protein|tara:strand:- start:1683 stop:1892 length:210 start_codon:yes stop_codon:yes gene_type:complete